MDFVTYEVAKKLKEKGFREPCFATYDNDGMLGYVYYQPQSIHAVSFDDCLYYGDDVVVTPTISQVLKWFREKKKIFIHIDVSTNDKFDYFFSIATQEDETWKIEYVGEDDYDTYEKAATDGIEYVLDNLI